MLCLNLGRRWIGSGKLLRVTSHKDDDGGAFFFLDGGGAAACLGPVRATSLLASTGSDGG